MKDAGPSKAHGGNVWAAARTYGLDPEEILDFSANLNPLGPPPGVLEILRDHLKAVRHYPEPRGGWLRMALASTLGLSPAAVVLGNGAAEIIYLLARILAPRTALIPAPTFSEYERAVAATGGQVEYFPLDPGSNFLLPTARLAAWLRQRRYDFLVLCNPNNPTGTLAPRGEVEFLVGEAERAGTFVLLDESFIEFTEDGERGYVGPERGSIIRGERAWPENLFLLRSFTKMYALPGLRLGYGVGPEELIDKIEAARDPWSVNALAQWAGLRCLEEKEHVQRTRKVVRESRETLRRYLSLLSGVKPYPSAANFILCDLRASRLTAPEVSERAARRGVLIRDCSNFPCLDDYYIRVAVRLREENLRLVEILSAVLRGTG